MMAGARSLPEIRGLNRPADFAGHWCGRNRAECPAVGRKGRDGDSFWAEVFSPFWHYSGKPVIRVYNVDCPEIFAPHSREELALGLLAKRFTESVVLGRQIGLASAVPEMDDHDRWSAVVRYEDEATGRILVLADELKRRRLTKSDVPDFAAATDAERAAWGAV